MKSMAYNKRSNSLHFFNETLASSIQPPTFLLQGLSCKQGPAYSLEEDQSKKHAAYGEIGHEAGKSDNQLSK